MAYDLLVDDPVGPWIEVVEDALRRRAAPLPARILDAGCGTGRHAAAFAALARAVGPGGIVVLDVRDRDATAASYGGGRRMERAVDGLRSPQRHRTSRMPHPSAD